MNLSGLLIGEGMCQRLENALSRMSHAYIISGPSESRIYAFAECVASACVCTGEEDRPCGICSACRKVKGNIHPDVIRISLLEGKREITVDQIRQLRTEAYIRPNEAQRKVFIIEHAQAMNDNAQNALLKVLEDGPGYLSFLLLAENPQQLLPTIRSRCETLVLSPQPGEDKPTLDENLQQQANQFSMLLLAQDERALAEYAIALELQKMDRDTFMAFVDAVKENLRSELLNRPDRVIPLMEHLDRIRKAALFNVGTGHLFGWLAVTR